MVEDNRRDASGNTTWSSTDTNTRYKTRLAHGGLGGPWWLALLLVPLLLALLIGGLGHGGVQDDLKARAAAALEAQGINGVGLDFSGRDGTLTVPDGVDADQAKKIVAGVDGVRVAKVDGNGGGAAATDEGNDDNGDGGNASDAASPYKLAVAGDQVTVTATVPDDAAKKALIDEVTTNVAPAKVIDDVTVEAGSAAIDPAKLGALAAKVKANDGVTADFDGTNLVLTGEVASDAISKDIEAAATAAVAPATVDNQLTVKGAGGGGDAAAACGDLNAKLAAAQKAGKLQFAESSPQLTNSGATLDKIAQLLKACPKSKVEIGGHTDNQGRKATSQPLSDARAKAVRQALINRGVPAAQMTAKGYGESKPIASNSTAEGRAENRRVEIKVL